MPRTWKESGRPAPGDTETGVPEADAADQADLHERLLEGLAELEDGIEAPGHVFSLVQNIFNLQRAALLLFDPVRMVFAPWALYGFDETTNHRLRIPLGANDTMNRLAAGKVHILADAERLQPFEQFFSFREFSSLTTLVLVPFIHGSKFMGLLLIAGLEGKKAQANLEIFEALSERAAGLFYQARERHLEGAKRGIPQRPHSLRQSVQNALQPLVDQGISPLMIRINTAKLVESVKQRNPYIDAFRLSQDISRVVLSQFQSLGPVFQIDRDRILIVVTSLAKRTIDGDSDLLLYHLKASLMRLLPELADQPELNLDEQVRVPKPEIEEVLTLLAEIV
ncbi:MAG: hypothetical protein JSV89_04430 [Spirochaetaceae bacterium]|nr:MAG: hypothetical protein JSV89_04430 [Spirochaetaceae bacterium]